VIEDPPILEIGPPFDRADAGTITEFRDTPTSFIVDAMGGRGALDWRIKPVGAAASVLGVALPCHCGPADNLALCAAVAECSPGDVIVAATDGFTGTAVVGDLLLGIARNRGAAGFVTDGLVRDRHEIAALGIACFAAGVSANSPARNGPGSVGLPVICGGVRICAGDIIIGDDDGVTVVPSAAVPDVAERLRGIRASEKALLAKVREGLTDVEFVREILNSAKVRHAKR
jgi:4-hydroxy-4-methyl-2-oxoglutarate aldolase